MRFSRVIIIIMSPLVKILIVPFLLGNCISEKISFRNGAPHVNFKTEALLSGTVKFSRDGRPYTAFEGVPFAKVTQRFSDPELIREADWTGIKDGSNAGSVCPQKSFGADIFAGEEDCLNLNVYVPLNAKKLPLTVMVWFHGGGFTSGAGSSYLATYFMDDDIVIVTTNYRLGVFGFLSTGDDVISGNSGLKDQVAALEWVQENIEKFGGDPNLVTIFGESAGGTSTHYLSLSPLTEGLFHRVISQSGSALVGFVPRPREIAVKLAEHLKCPSSENEITSEEIATCLRAASLEELNKAQSEFLTGWPDNIPAATFSPVVEPGSTGIPSNYTPFISESPLGLLLRNSSGLKNTPWMVGITEDEGACMLSSVVLTRDDLIQDLNENWNHIIAPAYLYDQYFEPKEEIIVAEKIRQLYFGDQKISLATRNNLTNVYSDALVAYTTQRAAFEVASSEVALPVYFYQYAFHGSVSLFGMFLNRSEHEAKKVGHGDELLYLFDMGIPLNFTEEEVEFSKNLVRLWVSFAVHGVPKHSWGNSPGREWMPLLPPTKDGGLTNANVRWYKIDTEPTVISHPSPKRMAFWDDLYKEHFEPVILSSRKSSGA